MKIGKDELGPIGIIGLVLLLPAAFLTFYGVLADFALVFVGGPLFAVAIIMYYVDLFEHRKKTG